MSRGTTQRNLYRDLCDAIFRFVRKRLVWICPVNGLRVTRRSYAYSKIAEQNRLFDSRHKIEQCSVAIRATNGRHAVVLNEIVHRKLAIHHSLTTDGD
jgi:hypothetical protein